MIASILFDILGIFNLPSDVMDGNIWQKAISVAGSMAAMLSFPFARRTVGHSGFLFTQ